MDKIKDFLSKYRTIITYIFNYCFGVVFYLTFYSILTALVPLSTFGGSFLSWVLTCGIVFLINKFFIFNSKSCNHKTLPREITLYLLSQFVLSLTLIFTFVPDMMVTSVQGASLGVENTIIKIVNFFVIIACSYTFNRMIIFKKDKKEYLLNG